jgi:hypothetical protein
MAPAAPDPAFNFNCNLAFWERNIESPISQPRFSKAVSQAFSSPNHFRSKAIFTARAPD